MDKGSLVADLSAIFSEDRGRANKAGMLWLALLTAPVVFGVGVPITFALSISGELGGFGILGLVIGVMLFVSFVIFAKVAVSRYVVSDLALGKLATANIPCRDAFYALKSLLKTQGCVTLGQVDIFLRAELRERQRIASLNAPGAKALIS